MSHARVSRAQRAGKPRRGKLFPLRRAHRARHAGNGRINPPGYPLARKTTKRADGRREFRDIPREVFLSGRDEKVVDLSKSRGYPRHRLYIGCFRREILSVLVSGENNTFSMRLLMFTEQHNFHY